MIDLPTYCLGLQIEGASPALLEKYLRSRHLPVVVRIVDNWLLFDPRTIFADEFPEIARACAELLSL